MENKKRHLGFITSSKMTGDFALHAIAKGFTIAAAEQSELFTKSYKPGKSSGMRKNDREEII